MKTPPLKILPIFLLLFVGMNCQVQTISKLTDKVREVTGNADKTFEQTTAISTSIKDTLYGIELFDEKMFIPEFAKEIGTSALKPGYYKSTVRSYCLKAGVYGPSKGDGYQIAKLKGSKSKIVHSILKKSIDHPTIKQSDVQTLIWGIEAGMKFTKFPLDFQLKVKPLVTAKDLLSMQINYDKLKDKMLPEEVQTLLSTYSSLRSKMQSTQMRYDEIEEVAVKTGMAPLGLGSKQIDKGIWSYIGNGFFLRAFPRGYSITDVELYRPAKIDVLKDGKGRIVSISDSENKMEIIYDDSFGADVFDYGHTKVPIWKIQHLHLRGSEVDQDTILKVDLWMFRGTQKKLGIAMQNAPVPAQIKSYQERGKGGPSPLDIPFERYLTKKEQPSWREVYDRFDKMNTVLERYQEVKKYVREIDEVNEVKPSDHYLNEEYANKRINDALEAVSDPRDMKSKADWIRENQRMIRDLFIHSLCALNGCKDNNPNEPDLPSYPAQPGNTSKQRIGLSRYPY